MAVLGVSASCLFGAPQTSALKSEREVCEAAGGGSGVCVPLVDTTLPSAWTLENGVLPQLSTEGTALRFAFSPGRDSWGNVRHTLELPENAVAIVWEEKVLAIESPGFRMLWLHEKDGDLWNAHVPTDVVGKWQEVVITFDLLSFSGRGNKKRELGTVNRLAMGFHNAPMTSLIRNLRVILRKPSVQRPPASIPLPDPSKRVAVLDSGKGRPHVADVLEAEGLGVRLVSPAALADPSQLAKANADLLIIPCSPFFPVAAVENFRRFLKDGGAFFAFGGYAFDKLADFPDAPDGIDFSRYPSVLEVNAQKTDVVRLNSRYGKVGDTVGYPHDVISVFDPSFLVKHVARVEVSADQPFLAPGSEFLVPATAEPYFAAVAMTGSNSPVFPEVYARWVPVLEAKDAFGRSRGPVFSLVLNYKGPYAGSAWAFSGHPTLFSRPNQAADRLFADVCRRLLCPETITTFKTDKAAIARGESLALTAGGSRIGPEAICRFFCGKRLLGEVPFVSNNAVFAYTPIVSDIGTDGLVEFSAEIVRGRRILDRKRTASVVVQKPCGPVLSFSNNMFAVNGRRRFFGGMNTTGMMWYSDNEDPLVWARDFSEMADYGMKFLRVLHFSPFAQDRKGKSIYEPSFLCVPPMDRTVRQTDAIVNLAAAHGVGVWLALHDWMPWELEPNELDIQAKWATYWAGRYADWPGVFYDIQNEPNPARLKLFSNGKSWRDLGARDGERRRAAYYASWQKANGDAVHAAAPKALVSVGHLQALNAVEKQLSTAGIDFSNVHHYGGAADLRSVVKLIDRRFEGKGLSLGEFGATVSHTARAMGQTGDPAERAIRHFLHVNHYLYAMGGAFTGVWDWKEFQDCVFPHGMTWQDGTPKPVLTAYRNLCLLLGEAGAMKEDPEVYLVLPDSFRLGGDSGRIHRAIQLAADALLSLNVSFGVINEEGLSRLPAQAKALVWPLAVCPSDGAFADVCEFVRRGGSLLVTGDFRFDADRQPTRLERSASLGLRADFPPLDPMSEQTSASIGLCTAARVRWSPKAIELTSPKAEVIAIYRAYLDEVACVKRLAVPGFPDGSVARFAALLEDGGRSETAVNTTDLVVSFDAVKLLPSATFWRRYSAEGKLTAASLAGEMPGLKVEGAPCAVLSLDDEAIGSSQAIALLPFGPCTLTLNSSAVGLTGEIGEFRRRRWQRLGLATFEATGTSVTIRIPADGTECDIRIFAAPLVREKAVAQLEGLL